MATENFYPGTNYPLDPKYGPNFTGYRIPAGQMGTATDPRTANQLNETSMKLNTGAQKIEVSAIQPNVFEAIPDQHLKEINRVAKLTGSETSVHAPMVEPSGYTQQGWSEAKRDQAENQIWSAVQRSNKVDDKGNVPVTFHPTYQLPAGVEKIKEGGEEKTKTVLAVDTLSGKPQQIDAERAFPGEEEIDPKEIVEKEDERNWNRMLNQINFNAVRGSERIDMILDRLGQKEKEGEISEEDKKKIFKAFKYGNPEELPKDKEQVASRIFRELEGSRIFLRDSYSQLRQIYNRVYKQAGPKQKKKLDQFKNEIKDQVREGIERDPEKLPELAEVVEKGIKTLGEIENPELLKPMNQFVIDQDSETFGNTAWKAYDKFGDKAPVINIENPPANNAVRTAEDIKNLIEKSRDKFVENAKKEKGMSKKKAEKVAEKLIGATWDVGHINMLRKYGYDKADIAKETEKIAPYVKHVHLSDNFGQEHTEIPMGMGNVPIKEMMKKLGKSGEEARKIIEAGDWFQHFKTPPIPETYGAMGSGLYPMKSPYWNQIYGTQASYSAGFGQMLPQQHFTSYGGGFSGMPPELGGQMPGQQQGGKQARMGGAPMQ